jgi:hypothetical protein
VFQAAAQISAQICVLLSIKLGHVDKLISFLDRSDAQGQVDIEKVGPLWNTPTFSVGEAGQDRPTGSGRVDN